jgi:hypothetical protein
LLADYFDYQEESDLSVTPRSISDVLSTKIRLLGLRDCAKGAIDVKLVLKPAFYIQAISFPALRGLAVVSRYHAALSLPGKIRKIWMR